MDNLKIEVIQKDGSTKIVDSIDGIRFNVMGEGNSVKLYEGTVFINCLFSLSGGMKIVIGSSKFNIVGLNIFGKESNVSIGSNFSCWGVEIRCHEQKTSVSIGANCMFAQDILIYATDVHSIFDQFTGKLLNLGEPVTIGDKVWCARGVTFLKGSTIRNHVVIGADSLVNKEFNENNVIIAGNPATVVRRGIDWARDTPFEYQQKLDRAAQTQNIIKSLDS